MQEIEPLVPGLVYHVYNQGVGGIDIFRNEWDYPFFLNQYAHYVAPVVDTFAYCLLKNHFHLLIRVKDFTNSASGWEQLAKDRKWSKPADASLQFSHFFNSYSQTKNHEWERKGGLFKRPFQRKPVDTDAYFSRAIAYVQTNAQRHGFVRDFKTHPHSSYHSHLSTKPTLLARNEVLAWFGNTELYQRFHETYLSDSDEEFGLEPFE